MKRKYFSALLMGALTVAAMSTVTSCKDYDDDINHLQKEIDDLSTFKTVKTDLETEISNLKTQLEAADGQLQEAINKKASTEDLEKLAARVASLESQIKTAEDANATLKELIAGKVDQSAYDKEVEALYAKIATVSTTLSEELSNNIKSLKDGLDKETTAREAADKDLQQQIDALRLLEERVKTLENNTATESKIKELTDALEALQKKVEGDETSISDLKKELKAVSDQINDFQSEINVLNVLLDQRLRSLVFIPESYYWGIEAQSFKYLQAKSWTLAATDYSTKERGYAYGTTATDDQVSDDNLAVAGKREDHGKGLYPSVDYTSVMDLWAQYHLNPSDVKADAFKSVSVLDGDKAYINTRASQAALSVKKDADGNGIYTVKDGILKVQLDVANPEKIMSVKENSAVTVFATQVHLNNNSKESVDTVITSDYATLYADKYTNIRLSHTTKGYHWNAEVVGKNSKGENITVAAHNSFDAANDQHNTHCGACGINGKDGLHLMATVHEATTLKAQDKCNWNQTLDLRELVETHWVNTSGKEECVSSSNMDLYGLSYKFELTGYWTGKNNTDESAHAAINPEDGYTFRPQMPEQVTGKQQAYGAVQDIQTVGRTPVVRVSLVDKYGKVLDYGYIRIEITRPETAQEYNYKEVDYTNGGNNGTFTDACHIDFKGYNVYQTKWIQTEYDIYNLLGMSREDFENYYGEEPVLYTDKSVAQWKKDASGKYVKIEEADTLGKVVNIPDMDNETHTQTSTLQWNIGSYKDGSANKMLKKLYDEWTTETSRKTAKTYTVEIAVKYTAKDSVDATIAPDVYVKFKTQVTFNPMTQWAATINWGSAKLSDYWYNTNTEVTGGTQDEIHVNVLTPEDTDADAEARPLDNKLSDNFVGNDVVKNSMVTSTQSGFKASEWKYSLAFDKSNVGKKFLGNDGKTYVLGVSADGKFLTAYEESKSSVVETVAELKVDDDHVGQADEADFTTVDYKENKFAKAMLNYASRYDYKNANATVLNNTLTAVIGVVAKNDCQTLALSNNTFNVRFIRPINVENINKSIEDASTEGLQVIKLLDLVKFTDWRNAWKGENPGGEYYKYYGVTGVKIAGVNDGEVISQNSDVKADINKSGMKSLSSQTKQLDFIYNSANGGTITYRNLSSTVNTFNVEIPITVSYIWGDIYTTATVTVNKTAGAKKH